MTPSKPHQSKTQTSHSNNTPSRSTGLLPPLNYGLPPEQHRRYTLVLDLDETLVHFDQKRRTYKPRPYASRFCAEMSKYFELVVFTAGLKDYADWILDDFDRARHIRYRLYRNSCKFKRGVYVKDLSCLGRDLSKTLIIDNIEDNFEMQPDNGINCESWFDNPNDTELARYEPILRNMALSNVDSVCDTIRAHFKFTKSNNCASPIKRGSSAPHAHTASPTKRALKPAAGAFGYSMAPSTRYSLAPP